MFNSFSTPAVFWEFVSNIRSKKTAASQCLVLTLWTESRPVPDYLRGLDVSNIRAKIIIESLLNVPIVSVCSALQWPEKPV